MKLPTAAFLPTFVLIAVISGLIPATHANSQPNRFRGTDGSGIYSAPELPVEWTEEDYEWTVELPGDGHSSPMIWKNHLYLTSRDAGKP